MLGFRLRIRVRRQERGVIGAHHIRSAAIGILTVDPAEETLILDDDILRYAGQLRHPPVEGLPGIARQLWPGKNRQIFVQSKSLGILHGFLAEGILPFQFGCRQ